MDFTLGEELEAVQELARQILTDHATQERLRAAEQSPSGIDERLWKELAGAGLLGVALPEEYGGADLGVEGMCVLLEEQGRHVAPVPLWPVLVAALTVARHGTAELRAELLPAVAEGTGRLTVALEEFAPGEPEEPWCVAVPADAGASWSLTGTKAVVPSITGAGHVLVAARTESGPGLFVMDAGAPGATWERVETTSRDIAGTLTLEAAPAVPLGDGALGTALELARVALTAIQVGVAEGAMRLAAGYLAERLQFGRPLATFQSVQHQLADCYIEIEAMRVCLWRAVSLIKAGEPAAADVLAAKWWADEGGLNVVHRTQHLHGGIGVDTDYPVHRYFLWGKQIAGTLGGASSDLVRLGSVLAAAGETTGAGAATGTAPEPGERS